jgi:hypothetical protein
MGSQIHNPDQPELSGTVEIDGAYFGGHVKPEISIGPIWRT